QIGYVVASCRQNHSIRQRHLNFKSNELFSVRNGIRTREVKNRLPTPALANPTVADLRLAQRISPLVPKQYLFQMDQTRREIRENLRRNFAAASLRAPNSGKRGATGWRIAHDLLFEDFERKPLFQFHSGGSQK